MKPDSSFVPPEVCPVCGTLVPPDARACPECGADEQTGWSARGRSDALGLPNEEFDYGEFVEREFGTGRVAAPRKHWLVWIAVALLCLALVALLL